MPSTVTCVDMHTNGEPFRIVVSSSPALVFPDGANIVEKRRFLRSEADWLRRVLMREPRGHQDMYGAFLTAPDSSVSAHVAVLFCHNEGYSTMCGHGTLALARYAVDHLMAGEVLEGETPVSIQCPCGLAEAWAEVKDGKTTGNSRFLAPQGYLHNRDLSLTFNERSVTFDIAYGGAFYAIVNASDVGLNLNVDGASKVVQTTMHLKREIQRLFPIGHADPRAPSDYLFLYGIILTENRLSVGPELKQTIVFAEGQIDRSPCGSGTAARLSALVTRGLMKVGDEVSLTNPMVGDKSKFKAKVTRACDTQVAMGTDQVTVDKATQCEIHGRAFYTGKLEFILEDNDDFQEGFLVRP